MKRRSKRKSSLIEERNIYYETLISAKYPQFLKANVNDILDNLTLEEYRNNLCIPGIGQQDHLISLH